MTSTMPDLARKRTPWLLIFNCQAQGLGNCLNALSDSIYVEAHDPISFRENNDAIVSRLDAYEKILIAPQVELQSGIDFGQRSNLWRVPPLIFHGYHPDLCYLAESGGLSKGPLGHYHSSIAYAAFRCGLSELEAVRLYCDDTYKRLKFYDAWDRCRIDLTCLLKTFDFNMEQNIVKWARRGPFMHTINHPKIDCLRDYAKEILTKASLTYNDTDLLPMDNLINGPIFPVYPEIGTRLGVHGSYLFKSGGGYQLKSLHQFVHESYAVYKSSSESSPSVAQFLPLIEKVTSIIKELACVR